MTPWHPTLLSHWYAVAIADRLGRRPLALTLLDQHLVLARLPTGQLVALEDRCPHRQAPLSAGSCSAAGIRCPYHGWTFDAAGALTDLPGAPPGAVLPPIHARAYAVREHDGLLWIRPGADAGTDLNALALGLCAPQRRFLWHGTWQAHVVDAMENFLDALHTHGVHPGLLRRPGERRPVRAELTRGPQGCTVDYVGQPEQSGLLFRLFESPRTLERAHYAAPGSTQLEYRYANGGVVRISLHFTPRTAELTDVFAALHVENRWAPAWLARVLVGPFLRRVAEQDRRILTLQANNLKRFPDRRMASTPLDLVRPTLERFWRGEGLPEVEEHSVVEMMI